MTERRSFSRKRNKSDAQYFTKEHKVSSVRKNWRAPAENALYFRVLLDLYLPEKLI